jgi:hypothetical protein
MRVQVLKMNKQFTVTFIAIIVFMSGLVNLFSLTSPVEICTAL